MGVVKFHRQQIMSSCDALHQVSSTKVVQFDRPVPQFADKIQLLQFLSQLTDTAHKLNSCDSLRQRHVRLSKNVAYRQRFAFNLQTSLLGFFLTIIFLQMSSKYGLRVLRTTRKVWDQYVHCLHNVAVTSCKQTNTSNFFHNTS